MTTIALPRPRNALLDRLRTIQIGIAARGAVGAGLATKAGGAAGGVDWSQWFSHFWLFKGAASQAASYVDVLASLTMTTTNAPTWSAAAGLTTNGSSQYMNIGFVPAANMSVMLQFTGAADGATGETSLIGHYLTSGARFQIGKQVNNPVAIFSFGSVLYVSPMIAAGNLALTGTTVSSIAYRNGIAETGSAGGFSATAYQTLLLGARRREDSSSIDLYSAFTAVALGIRTTQLNASQMLAAATAMAAL